MTGISRDALDAYAAGGAMLVARYEAVDAEAVFAPLAGYLPKPPVAALDVGAGSGRDAGWLAGRGYRVTAVEPTEALRTAGIARHGTAVEWVSDTLPALQSLAGHAFDLVWVNAVWHHLDDAERDVALPRLASLTRPGGRVLLSLRQGPAIPGRGVADALPAVEIERAHRTDLRCLHMVSAPARNDSPGIEWIWLVLERSAA